MSFLLPDSELKWRGKTEEEAEMADRLRWRGTGLETTNRRGEAAAVARVLRCEETILLHMMMIDVERCLMRSVFSQVTSSSCASREMMVQRFSLRRNSAATGFLLFSLGENCSICDLLGTCDYFAHANRVNWFNFFKWYIQLTSVA